MIETLLQKLNLILLSLKEMILKSENHAVERLAFLNGLNVEETTILMLTLVPYIQPSFFDELIKEAMPQGGDFPEFGGVRGTNHRGMLPTGETAQYVLAGNDMEKRIAIQYYFSKNHIFYREGILSLEALKEGEPLMSGKLILSSEWVDYLLFGKRPLPEFSADFPAKLLTTKMQWKDLMLHPYTFDMLSDLKHWLNHSDKLFADENFSGKIKPGYRALFYGPPGTGKTLTASLLGKEFDKEVYRIDLSMVVSKYIGETEKNLNKVFDKAVNKNWILFFDEADALFSKRTGVQSSNDKYANQEVSYLLQRVEDYPGMLILASNIKHNIDNAFLRRFNSVIHFPKPDAKERLRIWKNCIPQQLPLHKDVDLLSISQKYEITGSTIINVIQYASLRAFSNNAQVISYDDIFNGLKREFHKEDKSMN